MPNLNYLKFLGFGEFMGLIFLFFMLCLMTSFIFVIIKKIKKLA